MTPITAHAGPLLSVDGLTVDFDGPGGRVRVVDDVSFGLDHGETLGLVGESGCGKSVTAMSLVRLVPPPGRVTGGRILFEGRDLAGLDAGQLRDVRGSRIGVVFQEPATALTPVYTIGQQIAEAIRAHEPVSRVEAASRAVALLDEVAMPDPARRADDYPHQLSGGLRQRAMIAVALACGPALLIADEPTTALDVTVQAQVLDLLRRLQESRRLAVLLISHDLGVVAQCARRVAVMYAGRIVEQAPVRELFAHPAHPYTRALLESVPGDRPPGSRLRVIDGTVPVPGHLPSGCAFAPRCADRVSRCDTDSPAPSSVGVERMVRCHLAGHPS